MPAQEHVQQAAARRQLQQAKGYNKTALVRPLAPLQPGQGVRVQMERTSMWRPATVVSAAAAPRSYVVRTPDGATYRRNRAMLRPTSEPPSAPPQPEAGPELETIDVQDPDTAADVEPTRPAQPVITTRSGREVRPPIRFSNN